MARSWLQVRCQRSNCGELYRIAYSKEIKVVEARLDFAVCTHCLKPRNTKIFNSYKGLWRCCGCGLPDGLVSKRTKFYCATCYIGKRYKWKHGRRFVQEVAKPPRKILLLYGLIPGRR